ncbi:recombinase RecU [Levilactobacillus brevis]|nr:recombinase RecU [Levilactobacillus brevis]
MTLEEELNESNTYYEVNGVAVVHKKPTPIRIVKVDYPKRSAAVIKEAHFSTASTTDYNGVYRGHYLDFDAKETRNTTSFPLQNFHQHQIDHMRACTTQGEFVLLLSSSSPARRFTCTVRKICLLFGTRNSKAVGSPFLTQPSRKMGFKFPLSYNCPFPILRP